MKRNLTLILISSAALTACATVNDTANTVSDGYHQAAAAAAPTVAAAKAGAVEAGDHAANLGGAAKDGIYQVTDHVADWMRPTVPKPPQQIAASYCYHVYQDILCYRRPMPGWESRVAGYQPLTADPPAPAMMQPLPTHVTDNSKLPTNRVVASKPVFTELPQANAAEKPGEELTPASAAASDATHEQLPDPALAPQL